MKDIKSFKILDSTSLKIIALLSMVLDHAGDNFFPGQTWMRILGRIAIPIFCFCIAEGYIHTRDRMGYLKRMLIFALISEIPFDLVVNGKILEFSHQNVMFSFAWTILALMCFDRITENGSKGRYVLGILVLLISGIVSLLLGFDYNILVTVIVSVYYLLKNRPLWLRNIVAMLGYLMLRNVGIYLYGILGFLPLFLYSGKRGRGLKWLFYVFYPGHLLLIYVIRTLINK